MIYSVKRFSKKPIGDREVVDPETAKVAKETSARTCLSAGFFVFAAVSNVRLNFRVCKKKFPV